jgi:hypothetical protein
MDLNWLWHVSCFCLLERCIISLNASLVSVTHWRRGHWSFSCSAFAFLAGIAHYPYQQSARAWQFSVHFYSSAGQIDRWRPGGDLHVFTSAFCTIFCKARPTFDMAGRCHISMTISPFSYNWITHRSQTVCYFINQTIGWTMHWIPAGRLSISKRADRGLLNRWPFQGLIPQSDSIPKSMNLFKNRSPFQKIPHYGDRFQFADRKIFEWDVKYWNIIFFGFLDWCSSVGMCG